MAVRLVVKGIDIYRRTLGTSRRLLGAGDRQRGCRRAGGFARVADGMVCWVLLREHQT